MKKWIKTKFWVRVFPVILILSLLSACATAAPQDQTIPVKLEAGKLNVDPIQVNQNDTITLKIETDEPGSFHLHGYDIEQEITPEEITDFVFVADASGRFRIEFHSSGSEHNSDDEHMSGDDHMSDDEHMAGHGEELQSEVIHPGDTFTFAVPHDAQGKTIPYHSHLHPEVSGMIEVSDDAPAAEVIQVQITDGATDPSHVMARPGTTITWTNNSSETQALASGEHPDSMTEDGSEASHEHDEHDEGEVKDIGFLEVSPR